MTEKICQLGHNVQKGRLVNIVTARFNTIMGQMTKISQQKRNQHISHCLDFPTQGDRTLKTWCCCWHFCL